MRMATNGRSAAYIKAENAGGKTAGVCSRRQHEEEAPGAGAGRCPGPRWGGNMRIWHYTTWDALEGIFNDGEIHYERTYHESDIRCVWLSTNTNWEETVRKGIKNTETGIVSVGSRDALFNAGFSPTRIEINLRAVKIADWKTHCKKLSKRYAQGLEIAAKVWGANPLDWWVSYKPIPVKSFASSIEEWDGKRWIKHSRNKVKIAGAGVPIGKGIYGSLSNRKKLVP